MKTKITVLIALFIVSITRSFADGKITFNVNVNGNRSTSYTLTGLAAATSYQFQLRTSCSIWTSQWSATTPFTTEVQKLEADSQKNPVSIFPNPASEYAAIKFNLEQGRDVMINIHDLTGAVVKSFSFTGISAGENDVRLDISNLSAGNYFVMLTSNLQKQTVKLSIER